MQGIEAHGKMPSVTFSQLLFLTGGSFILSSINCVNDTQSYTDFNYSLNYYADMDTKQQRKYFIKVTSIIFLIHKMLLHIAGNVLVQI